ncbi:MAG: glycine cleavage system protein R [Oceanipulchritudo sp.]
MKDVILTLIGPDRTGMVSRLAALAEQHGGNWLDSRMIRLGGYFSGMVRIALPEGALPGFREAVAGFLEEREYQYTIQRAELERALPLGRTADLVLSGQDHPGIVHGLFETLQESGVNVEELSTGLTAAPWSGTPVFEARAKLYVPESVAIADLQERLESLAADLLVEIDFSEGG